MSELASNPTYRATTHIGAVAQSSSIQKTTKDFVPEGLDERSLAVYCPETIRESVPSR
jgi:hypothetical protein